jgi:hypothetical protein
MFTSEENKDMVWGLLVDQSKIPLNRQWRDFFNQTVNKIEREKTLYENVIQMNKQLLSTCMLQINNFANLNFNSKNNLQQKQEQLKLMREGPKKKEINFADKDDTEYGNLNFLMDQANADRERELQEIKKKLSKPNIDANKWLNVNTDKAPEIKIDKNSNVEIKNEIIPAGKTVKFNLTEKILKTRAKITYTEDGKEKILFCHINKNFRLFSSEHGNIEENITARIENVELF